MYTVHDQEPHMLSSDSQWLDLICVGRWLVTCAPTAAVGAASSLSPLKKFGLHANTVYADLLEKVECGRGQS